MTNTEIIELYMKRNEQAIEATAEQYGGRFIRFARNFLPPEDAEECVNDLYLALWEHIPKAKPDNLYAYAIRALRNLALNRLRSLKAEKRKAEIVSLTDELAASLEDANLKTEDEVIARIFAAGCINEFLQSLNEEKQYLFIHRYWFGESLEELERTTGFSRNRIGVTLFRLRKKLEKTLLRKEGSFK